MRSWEWKIETPFKFFFLFFFFTRNKKYDMFAFLASTHRVPPQLEESAEEQESAEQARDGPLSVRYVKTLLWKRYRQKATKKTLRENAVVKMCRLA